MNFFIRHGKRLDFLSRKYKKRTHLGYCLVTKINCRRSKRKRLERHYRKCLEAIEISKKFFKYTKDIVHLVCEGLGNYSKPYVIDIFH